MKNQRIRKLVRIALGVVLGCEMSAAGTEVEIGETPFEIVPGETVSMSVLIDPKEFAPEEEAVLEVTARVQSRSLAGYTPAVRVFYNGEEQKKARNRPEHFKVGDGRDVQSFKESQGWVLAYAPSVQSLKNVMGDYAPVDSMIDISTLRFSLGLHGGKDKPKMEGEVSFEVPGPDLLDRNVIIENISILFLSTHEADSSN